MKRLLFILATTSAASAAVCQVGYYDTRTSAGCAQCPAGKFQAMTGQSSCDECYPTLYQVCFFIQSLNPSTLINSSTHIDPTRAQDRTGQASCKSCNETWVGSTSLTSGSTNCPDCIKGLFTFSCVNLSGYPIVRIGWMSIGQ